MAELLTAVAMVLVIEGVLYALLPEKMQGMMRQMIDMPPSQLRAAGLVAACIGVLAVWVIKL